MSTTTEYITKPGDRWDLIAYRAYGTIDKIGDIIRANPGIPVSDVLSEGLLLQIPVIANADSKTDENLLPPWKRNS